MGDSIHKTHFQVPEMPWREKEKQAILLLQRMMKVIVEHEDCYTECSLINDEVKLLNENKDLVDWVMKYKGE